MGLLGGGQFGFSSRISFQDCDLMCCSSTGPEHGRTQLASSTGYKFHTESDLVHGTWIG